MSPEPPDAAPFHGWGVFDGTEVPHVIPLHDMRSHAETVDCWCEPRMEENVMVHRAMDCREVFEHGRKFA